jgi:1-pyrroline-5-carboxylate dehydrogenase
MTDGMLRVPAPVNEPVRSYAPGSPERASLKRTLARMMASDVEIPLRVGDHELVTGDVGECRPPHEHAHRLARYHRAGSKEIQAAIEATLVARADWIALPWESRAAVFLKAAELLTGPYRDEINAATMLGQSKTAYQAEIDSACELADFWRFNVHYMEQLYREQPQSAAGTWNTMDHRPLEGFVFAVTPFNFTAIAGNLPTAPVMLGNVALWKPAESAVYSAAVIERVLAAAGLPPGVITCVRGDARAISEQALAHPQLAGIHFTGSTGVFHALWRKVGENIDRYRSYPRLVGETGGKDFVFAHPSADIDALVVGLVRGAFEYQGQKCSAASRAFIPDSLWQHVLERLEAQVAEIRMGSPLDFRNFMSAVIDSKAYTKITSFVEFARHAPNHEILFGGEASDEIGYFIRPTVVAVSDPHARLMCEEIFGPVLALHRYPDAQLDAALEACDSGSPYGLTGAIFCRDRAEIVRMSERLRFAAGNFYINDKPTGAVVSQQPFGGGRASGTNDKAGSILNLMRWISPRAIKESFVPPKDFRYPHMYEE